MLDSGGLKILLLGLFSCKSSVLFLPLHLVLDHKINPYDRLLQVRRTKIARQQNRSDHVPREEIAEEIEQLHLVGPVQRLAT
jgi:hypothetical protein